MRKTLAVLGLTAAVAGIAAIGIANAQSKEASIGLITKTESNPFFVKMREGASKKAAELGAKFTSASGKFDADTASQITAIENMVAGGVNTILLVAADSKALVPSIKKARDAGVMVIALDSPTEPADAVDALFATDNYEAGLLIGQYAKKLMGNKKAIIATIDLSPGPLVGILRHNGFLAGFGFKGITAKTPNQVNEGVACAQDGFGDQAKGQTAMENCLQKNPDINVVYTINEPDGYGAYQALKNAGKEKQAIIVSVDGGCNGVRGVQGGQFVATSQQYPLLMASKGVEAGVEFAKTGKRVSGYVNTGVNLIAAKKLPGIKSQTVKFGLDNCWGQ